MTEPSLAGFLELTGAKFSCFDLSVQLKKLPKSTLSDLDAGKPYSTPHLNFAWLVILLWNPENKDQNSFWFLKLPLDEQGQLSPGVHSDLVNRLYRSVQTQDEKERQRLLTDHPYQFSPNEEKKAALHAQASKLLASKSSQFYAPALEFYTDANSPLQWQALGLQGISDLLVRLDSAQEQALIKQIPHLDSEPFIALMNQMEHTTPSTQLVEAVLSRSSIYTQTSEMIAAIRGVSQAKANKLVRPLIDQGLKFFANQLELLLAIITRYPHWMTDVQFSVPVLDQLAQSTDQDGFQKIIHHLAILPGLQGIVMSLLGAPNITPALANALSIIIQQHRVQKSHVH
ncbi:DUF3549 family protein [Reinekea forsetii]|nr:DUF3549 family protein [Reinekea forsetii]